MTTDITHISERAEKGGTRGKQKQGKLDWELASNLDDVIQLAGLLTLPLSGCPRSVVLQHLDRRASPFEPFHALGLAYHGKSQSVQQLHPLYPLYPRPSQSTRSTPSRPP